MDNLILHTILIIRQSIDKEEQTENCSRLSTRLLQGNAGNECNSFWLPRRIYDLSISIAVNLLGLVPCCLEPEQQLISAVPVLFPIEGVSDSSREPRLVFFEPVTAG